MFEFSNVVEKTEATVVLVCIVNIMFINYTYNEVC